MNPDSHNEPASTTDEPKRDQPMTSLERQLDLAKRRIAKLERDRAILRNRLALANWNIRANRARSWSRLGPVVAAWVRRPWRLMSLVRGIGSVVLRPTGHPPRPKLEEVPEAPQAVAQEPPKVRDVPTRPPGPGLDPFESVLRPIVIAAPVPVSAASRVRPTPHAVRIAAVLDAPIRQSLSPECRLITFTPQTWLEVLEREQPDLLLVESAWRANQGSWEYRVGSFAHPESVELSDLRALIDWCRHRSIPTVFWSTADPIHFERFKAAAALFDLVFTTDPDTTGRYERLPGSVSTVVGVLPFAVQPRLFDPVGASQSREPRPFFDGPVPETAAGRQSLRMLLDAAARHDPTVDEASLLSSAGTYRQHRVVLSAGDLRDPPPEQVYAALACGTPVVSTPGIGRLDAFGSGMVVVDDPQSAQAQIDLMLSGGPEWAFASRDGIEAVYERHTYADRLHVILAAVGIESAPPSPRISAAITPDASVTVQEAAGAPYVSEVLVARESTSGATATARYGSVPVSLIADGDALDRDAFARSAGMQASEDWVALISDVDDLAGLRSLAVATRITDAEIYCAAASAAEGHQFVGSPSREHPVLYSSTFLARFGPALGPAGGSAGTAARVYAVPIIDA